MIHHSLHITRNIFEVMMKNITYFLIISCLISAALIAKISKWKKKMIYRFLYLNSSNVGPTNVLLLVHGFPAEKNVKYYETQLRLFRKDQPTAKKCTNNVILCSDLSSLTEKDGEVFSSFVNTCAQVKSVKSLIFWIRQSNSLYTWMHDI